MFRKFALVLAAVPCLASAQEDAVVVTASRTTQRLRDAIPHTTVLTQKEIRDSQAVDLPTLLRSEAGFEMAQTGGIGSVPSPLSLRGSTSARALVLIDGVRIEDVGVSSTALQHIMLDQVERVEIARGNLSSLYGSNAVGGVIQIFTKRGTGAPAPYGQLMAGSRNTSDLSAGYGGELGASRFNVTASRYDTRGFSSIDPALAPLANPDPDGYRNQSVSLSGSQRLNPSHELGVAFFGTSAYLDYDSQFGPPSAEHRSNQDLSMLQGWWEARLAEWWKSRFTLSETKDRRTDTVNDAFSSNGNTRTRQVIWDSDLRAAPAHTFSVGLEGREQVRDSGSSFSGPNPRKTRDVGAGRVGYVGRFGDHTVQANYRYEDYSDFGSEGTYYLGYGYDLTAAWRATLSRGTAFRAPTFLDLDPLFLGNPDLQPERSSTNEIGVQWAAGPHRVRVTYFDTEYEDAIVLTPAFMPQNVQTASNQGIETSYSGVLAGFDVRASLTVQDPEEQDRTNLPAQQALRRAKTLAALAAHRSFGAWRAGAEWRYSGERRDQSITSSSTTVFEPAYSVLDLMVRYRLARNIHFGARLENALDEDYRLVNGYNTPGRGVFFTASWQP